MTSDLRVASRTTFSTRDNVATHEEIRTGSMQRIADAVEKVAENYDRLRADRDLYKRWYEERFESERRIGRSNAALRGVITKLKNKGPTKCRRRHARSQSTS